MQGRAVTFERYFPEDVPAARARYHNETRRLYEVMSTHLKEQKWLAENFQ
jgi:GSH-dependent disulfide-bond oxidoreductase